MRLEMQTKQTLLIGGLVVVIVGIVLILTAISTPICPLPKGNVIGGCTYFGIYSELYLGIALLVIGAITGVISFRMKSKPAIESEQRRNLENA
jgi:hypothetical protein